MRFLTLDWPFFNVLFCSSSEMFIFSITKSVTSEGVPEFPRLRRTSTIGMQYFKNCGPFIFSPLQYRQIQRIRRALSGFYRAVRGLPLHFNLTPKRLAC